MDAVDTLRLSIQGVANRYGGTYLTMRYHHRSYLYSVCNLLFLEMVLADSREVEEPNTAKLVGAHLAKQLLDWLLVCAVSERLVVDQRVKIAPTVPL